MKLIVRVLVPIFAGAIVVIGAVRAAEPAVEPAETPALSAGSIPASSPEKFRNRVLSPHVLVDPDYFIWGATAMRWTDGRVHLYYARWPKSRGFGGWITHCEIAHAVADRPEGPFSTTGTVIESRNLDGWDIVNAHNPSVCVADGKIHLYYISNRLRGEFEATKEHPFPDDRWLRENGKLVRNRQCIGVASADTPAGPFVRAAEPVVVPHGRFKNIAVNPAVIFHEGRFIMIVKGDDIHHEEWFRIQLVGHSENASGPFVFQEEPIYDREQTEDACLWYDPNDGLFHSLFHVIGRPVLAHLVSEDSLQWREGDPFTFTLKQFELADGTIWKPRRFERPFVLTDETGRAETLYVAVLGENGESGNVAVPLKVMEKRRSRETAP